MPSQAEYILQNVGILQCPMRNGPPPYLASEKIQASCRDSLSGGRIDAIRFAKIRGCGRFRSKTSRQKCVKRHPGTQKCHNTPHSAPKCVWHSSRPRRHTQLTRQGYLLQPRKYIATIVPLPKTRPTMSTERISSKTVDETGRFRRSN